jgi:hypothetical protein
MLGTFCLFAAEAVPVVDVAEDDEGVFCSDWKFSEVLFSADPWMGASCRSALGCAACMHAMRIGFSTSAGLRIYEIPFTSMPTQLLA